MPVNNKHNSRRGNIYNDKVLVGNWYEERLDGYMPLQDGNKDSEYQREYSARVPPKRDESSLWKTRIRALVLTEIENGLNISLTSGVRPPDGKYNFEGRFRKSFIYGLSYHFVRNIALVDFPIENLYMGLPIMLIREHGIRGGYRNNLSSLYDLNCAIAYHERPERRFNTVANTFVPEQDFTVDYGPGRNNLIGRKLAAWAEDKRITDGANPATEYQCCFTSQNG